MLAHGKNLASTKYELIKLMQGSKERIQMAGLPQEVTYERLSRKLEDCLKKGGYYTH